MSLDGQKFTENEIQLAASLRANIRPSPEGSSNPSEAVGTPLSRRKVKMNVVSDITEIPQPRDDVDSIGEYFYLDCVPLEIILF